MSVYIHICHFGCFKKLFILWFTNHLNCRVCRTHEAASALREEPSSYLAGHFVTSAVVIDARWSNFWTQLNRTDQIERVTHFGPKVYYSSLNSKAFLLSNPFSSPISRVANDGHGLVRLLEMFDLLF
jgi:hypothetical protein